MAYELSTGTISERGSERPPLSGTFRIALMGDFSGRGNRGDDTPPGERKPLKVEFDTLDDVLEAQSITLRIPIAGGAAQVEIDIGEMDDFHPDQLFDKLGIIDEIHGLARRVERKPDKAIPLILGWGADAPAPSGSPTPGRGAALPAAASLGELAGHVPAPAVPEDAGELEGNDLYARLVGPYVRDLPADADAAAVQEALRAAADGLLREIMHHPDFRALEAAWRGLEWLLRRTAKADCARVVLFDVGAAEFAADLAAAGDLEASGIFDLLVRQTAESLDGDPWGAVVGLYGFDLVPAHAELLGRMASICHRLHAPFIAGVQPRVLAQGGKLEEAHTPAWEALRVLPESRYLGLAGPGFLLRLPYGEDAEETEAFPFEELRAGDDRESYLWGSAALVAAALLVQDFRSAGDWDFRPGQTLRMGGMTLYSYRDEDGEGVAVMVEARALSSVAEKFSALGPMVLSAERGTDVVLFGAIRGLHGEDPALLGPWGASGGSTAPDFTAPAEPEPEPEPPPEESGGDRAAGDDTDAPAAGGGEDGAGDDLDSLLSSLDDDGADDAAGGGDGAGDDLDSLLSSLDDDGDDSGGGDEDDVDALLASLDDDDDSDDEDGDEDLDALLASLDDDDSDLDDLLKE